MVKRKSSFDLVEKVAKKPKTARTVSKKLDFESMPSVVDEAGNLLVERGDEVFFERTKESKTIVCVGQVITVYASGRHEGTVDIWDETHEECWAFNSKRDMDKVRVRFRGVLPKAVPVPAVEPFVLTHSIEEEEAIDELQEEEQSEHEEPEAQ